MSCQTPAPRPGTLTTGPEAPSGKSKKEKDPYLLNFEEDGLDLCWLTRPCHVMYRLIYIDILSELNIQMTNIST